MKVDRIKRKFLHAVWIRLVCAPVGNAASEISYLVRTEKAGLTPKEREFLLERKKRLNEIHEDLLKIYFRLKV